LTAERLSSQLPSLASADEAAFQAQRQTRHFGDYIETAVVPLLVECAW
jgi:hypothetical protein